MADLLQAVFGGGSKAPKKAKRMVRKPKKDVFPPRERGAKYAVTIYVPSTKEMSKPISAAAFRKRVDSTKRQLAIWAGGFSAVRVGGGWVQRKDDKDRGRLIKEKVVKVTAFMDATKFKKAKRELPGFLKKIKKAWGQESIGVSFESPQYPTETMWFV